jgi:hypothetical protein
VKCWSRAPKYLWFSSHPHIWVARGRHFSAPVPTSSNTGRLLPVSAGNASGIVGSRWVDTSIKFLSDMFSGRLYRLAAAKVGVEDYRRLVDAVAAGLPGRFVWLFASSRNGRHPPAMKTLCRVRTRFGSTSRRRHGSLRLLVDIGAFPATFGSRFPGRVRRRQVRLAGRPSP